MGLIGVKIFELSSNIGILFILNQVNISEEHQSHDFTVNSKCQKIVLYCRVSAHISPHCYSDRL